MLDWIKNKIYVYAMVYGLHYDLNVDYSTQLRKEFGNNIAHTNVVNCVSCVRYWSLILQYVYEKESIMVPADVPKA